MNLCPSIFSTRYQIDGINTTSAIRIVVFRFGWKINIYIFSFVRLSPLLLDIIFLPFDESADYSQKQSRRELRQSKAEQLSDGRYEKCD